MKWFLVCPHHHYCAGPHSLLKCVLAPATGLGGCVRLGCCCESFCRCRCRHYGKSKYQCIRRRAAWGNCFRRGGRLCRRRRRGRWVAGARPELRRAAEVGLRGSPDTGEIWGGGRGGRVGSWVVIEGKCGKGGRGGGEGDCMLRW